MMKTRNRFIVLGVSAALAACGGGSGGGSVDSPSFGSPTASDSATVSTFITDNLTTQYSEVWITVHRVTAENAASQVVTLFDEVDGKVVNLSALVNIGELLNTVAIPGGTYDDFVVTVANGIRLVDKNGVTTTATFGSTVDTFSINVDGKLALTNGQATAFALDFDLARFTLDPVTNVVSPAVIYKGDDVVSQFAAMEAELKGTIQSVSSNDSFVLVPRNSGAPVTVTYNGTTLFYDDELQRILSADTVVSQGAYVEVEGAFDRATLQLSANEVSLEDEADDSASDTVGLREVEGVVQSFDGSTLVMDVREGDFLPSGNTLTVANVSNAVFHESTLQNLQPGGQWIELKGQWDGVTFTALVVELDDGVDEEDDSENDDDDIDVS
jgi:hypothetical protein